MKSTTVIVLILTFNFVFISNFFGQVVPDEELQSQQELYDFHIDKMKSNKTAAWITLGGGIAMIVGGAAIDFADNFDFSSDSPETHGGKVLMGVGIVTTLTSIPLFIAGHKHKSKAQIQLKNGAIGGTRYKFTGLSIAYTF